MQIEIRRYLCPETGRTEQALEYDMAAYDLILLDIMMDGMSGTELAARLKEHPATAAIPINLLQESQESVASLRKMLRAAGKLHLGPSTCRSFSRSGRQPDAPDCPEAVIV